MNIRLNAIKNSNSNKENLLKENLKLEAKILEREKKIKELQEYIVKLENDKSYARQYIMSGDGTALDPYTNNYVGQAVYLDIDGAITSGSNNTTLTTLGVSIGNTSNDNIVNSTTTKANATFASLTSI